MALTVNDALVAKFGLDQSEYQRGMRQAVRTADRSSARMTERFKRVGVQIAAIGTAAVGLGALFAKSAIDAARTSENLRLRLDALLGSTQEGARAFELMSAFAATVPFEFEEIMSSATQLAGIVKGGAREIADIMPIIADLAAVSGLSIQQTTEQIVRSFSAGIGSADLFRERGITAMLGFQAGATVSAQETRDGIIAAWNDTGSKFRGASERMAETWDGIMSMISDRWFQFRNLVADAGLFDLAKEGLTSLLDAMDTAINTIAPILKAGGPAIKEAAKIVGTIAGTAFALGVVLGVRRSHSAIRDAITGFIPVVGPRVIQPLVEFADLFDRSMRGLAEDLRETLSGSVDDLQILSDTTSILQERLERGRDAANELGAAIGGANSAAAGGVSIGEVSGPPNELLMRLHEAGEQVRRDFEEANAGGARLVTTIREVPAQLELTDQQWQAYLESQRKAITLGDRLNQGLASAASMIGDNIARGITGLITQTQSLADTIRSVVVGSIQAVISALIRATVQAAIFRAIMGGATGGTGLFFQSGGMIPAPAGQAMPIVAHGGEAVLNREAVQRIGGAPAVNAINRGEPPRAATSPVNIVVDLSKLPRPLSYREAARDAEVVRLFVETARVAAERGA